MKPKVILCRALVLGSGLFGCSTAARHCCNVQSAKVVAVAKVKLKFVKVDSEETESQDGHGENAVDGNHNTYWHTQWHGTSPGLPHEIIIELIPPSVIKGFTYLPRQDESDHGTIKDYEFYVSDDGKNFGEPVKKGTFEPGRDEKFETFAPIKCRFIKLKAVSEINGEPWTSVAEIGVIQNGENISVMTNLVAQVENLLVEFEMTKSIDKLEAAYVAVGNIPEPGGDKTVPKAIARREKTLMLFKLIAVIDQNINTNYDNPTNWPAMNLSPPGPGGMNYPSGVDPNDIKEPEIRAQYEAALKQNEEKVARDLFQTRLHNIDQSANIFVRSFLQYNYTTSKEDQNEFENLMQQAKLSPVRTQKLKALFSTVVAGTCSPYGKLVLSGQTLYGTTSSDSDSWGAQGGAVFKVNIDGTGFAVLHHFPRVTYPNPTNSDGTGPMTGLLLLGNYLFGTTPAGGAAGYGTIFKVSTNGKDFAVLHAFTGSDGEVPKSGLVLLDNTLYGITQRGGHNEGVIFKVNTDGTAFATLHVFSKLGARYVTTTNPITGNVWVAPYDFTNSDGAFSESGLTLSGKVLYGTGWSGGPGGVGTIFKMNIDGSGFTLLHGFTKERVDRSSKNWISTNSDGAWPATGLMVNGISLYGIASEGGVLGKGTAFKINTDGTGFAVLHNYDNITPQDLIWLGKTLYGITPEGSLLKFDTQGADFSQLADFEVRNGISGMTLLSGKTFYGTTSFGGNGGGGTMFKVNANGTGFKVLHNFIETPPPPGMTD